MGRLQGLGLLRAGILNLLFFVVFDFAGPAVHV